MAQLPSLGVNASLVTAYDVLSIDPWVMACKSLVHNTSTVYYPEPTGRAQLSAVLKLFVALFDMLRRRRQSALVCEDDVAVDHASLPSLWVALHDAQLKTTHPSSPGAQARPWWVVDLGGSAAATLRFLRQSGVTLRNYSRHLPPKELSGIWQRCSASSVALRQCALRPCPAPLTILFSGSYAPTGHDQLCCTTGIAHPKSATARGGHGLQPAVGSVITARGAYLLLRHGMPITDAIDLTLSDARLPGASATLSGHWVLKPYVFRPAHALQRESIRPSARSNPTQ